MEIFEVMKAMVLREVWRREIRQQQADQQAAGDAFITRMEQEASK